MKKNIFIDDWEFQKEMRPYADEIYHQVWGQNITITRAGDEKFLNEDLDRLLAIDVIIESPRGLSLTGQEKFRRPQGKIYYGDFTIEYYQDPKRGYKGDWFHFGGNWYFCGIATSDKKGFRPWVIADWMQLQKATNDGYLNWKVGKNKEHGKSDFAYVKMKALPPSCVIRSSYKYHINLGPLFNGYVLKEQKTSGRQE